MRGEHGFALVLTAVVVAVWAAAMGLAVGAAAPPEGGGRMVAVFPPGHSEASFTAIVRAGARPVGRSWAGLVWAVDTDPGGAERLRAQGALAVLEHLPLATALGCAPAAPLRP